mmetsp:Transcript_120392/g.347969  ORF Transcript_120392/g.347969 Transcript_120392/m.347969 type:complete len:301 (-) Transcript_120392:107-1009(-)
MLVAFGDKNDRNSIFFRFASEGEALEKVEFIGKDIAVGDLRQAIAERKNLSKLDIELVNEANGEVYEKGGKLLPRNTIVTVRRTPVRPGKLAKQSVLHLENVDAWAAARKGLPSKTAVPPEPIQKRPFPAEYICPVCNDIFNSPSIARCCGRSACAACFERRRGAACPLCSREWVEDAMPIPNRSLAASVASLNLDYFVLPSEARAAAEAARAPPPPPSAPNAGVADFGRSMPPCMVPQAQQGVIMRPCMLSPEEFFMWQQALREGDFSSSSSSSSPERKRRKKDKSKDKSKKKKKRRRE